MTPEKVLTVTQALLAVMEEVRAVGKDGHNQQQNYPFRGIDGVVNAVGPALRKHGVLVVPELEAASYRDCLVGQKQTPQRECTVKVNYTFYGPAGDHITASVPGEALDSGDKSTAKAMSVAYRICLLQALTIPTHEADPDESSPERAAPSRTPSPKPQESAPTPAQAPPASPAASPPASPPDPSAVPDRTERARYWRATVALGKKLDFSEDDLKKDIKERFPEAESLTHAQWGEVTAFLRTLIEELDAKKVA